MGGADRPRSQALVAVLGAICALVKGVLKLWYVRLRIRVRGRAAESRTLALVAVLGANHALAKDALQLRVRAQPPHVHRQQWRQRRRRQSSCRRLCCYALRKDRGYRISATKQASCSTSNNDMCAR